MVCDGIRADGRFKVDCTGRGLDVSPGFGLSGLPEKTGSLAVVLRDVSHPLFGSMTHWLIWDLQVADEIPGSIPSGARPGIGESTQGIAYGWHRYRGPKPPAGTSHRYEFTVYAFDRMLGLRPTAGYRGFLKASEGRTLGIGKVQGVFE